MTRNWQSAGRPQGDQCRREVLSLHELEVLTRESGHRIGAEPFALVNTLPVRAQRKAIDLGCGSGIIPLLLSRTGRASEIWGIEIEADDAALAERNVAGNGLTGIISIKRGHVRRVASTLTRGVFDLITCNPPFFKATTDAGDASAVTHEMSGTLHEFLAAGAHLAKRGALLAMVYHPSRFPELLAALPVFRFGPAKLFCVHSARQRPASFVVVHAVAQAQPRFDIMPPLILDEEK